MKRIFLLLPVAGVLLSCTRIGPEPPSGTLSSERSNPMEISCEPLAGERASTRSSFKPSALTRVSDVCVFIYKDGTLVDEKYFDTPSGISVTFPSSADTYNVYMLANMGDVTAPSREADISGIKYTFVDYGTFNRTGFPMANSFLNYTPGSSTQFKLKRLIGMYTVWMDNTSDVVDYRIKSLQLRNCARDIYPFGNTAAQSFQSEGDCLSDEDIENLNDGGSVDIYFLENLQGELLPGNTDPKQKIPDNLPDEKVAGRCTYIQMLADVTTPTAHYENIYYRVYLGQNMTTDFSIVRSTLYNLCLNFETNMIADEGWRIEPEDPEVIGSISLNKSEAKVISGIDDIIFVTTQSANGCYVDFDVTLNSAEATAARLSYTKYSTKYHGEWVTAIKFTTALPIDGLNSYDQSPDNNCRKVHVTITSKDKYNGQPTISKSALVKVYHEAFPIYLKTRKNGSSYDLYAYSNNPMGLSYRFDYKTYAGQDLDNVVVKDWNRFQRYGIDDTLEPGEEWSIEDNTLNRNGSRIGSLGSADRYSDGMRIDVTVTPVSDNNFGTPYSNECFLEYPKFANGTAMYTGTSTKAYFGPGPNLSPGNQNNFSDDSAYNIQYGGAPNTDNCNGFSFLFSSNGTNFAINSGCTGWNRHNSYTLSSFSGCPFYFVNGGLTVYDRTFYNDEPRYLDDTGRMGVEVYAYEPGRDLGAVSSTRCTFGFKIGTMTQFFGNHHTWQDWKSYDYNIYMTINGCTGWPGASNTSSGFSPGFYEEDIEW